MVLSRPCRLAECPLCAKSGHSITDKLSAETLSVNAHCRRSSLHRENPRPAPHFKTSRHCHDLAERIPARSVEPHQTKLLDRGIIFACRIERNTREQQGQMDLLEIGSCRIRFSRVRKVQPLCRTRLCGSWQATIC